MSVLSQADARREPFLMCLVCSLRPSFHRGKLIHAGGPTFYPGGGRGK